MQFAKAAGATVIATTSSAEKAEVLKKLGADHVINYREDPNWGETARKLTPNGEGVEHVLEVGGAGTITQSLKAIKMEGVISVIGFLGGADSKESTLEALNHVCTIRGVYVGSREQLEEMVAAMEKHDIHPVVDKTVFTLDKVREAYEYMVSRLFFSGDSNAAVDLLLTDQNSGRRSTLARSALRLSNKGALGIVQLT
jgi:NADPH:quinone reductase-like Zn-dependent oxidoreductase